MALLLVLWDVDHTLIDSGGVSKSVYARAFEMLTGQVAIHPVETEGRTDPVILNDLLRRHEFGPVLDPSRMEAILAESLSSKAQALARRGRALPGAREALVLLQGRRGVVQSVLTGNVRANAVVKLATFGLGDLVDFEVGGYGSDDPVRAKLVGVAQGRAASKYGSSFGPENTVLIGDTPRDVRAGLEGGARVVAVATGASTIDELRSAGADVVLEDLTRTEDVLSKILGASEEFESPTPERWVQEPPEPAV